MARDGERGRGDWKARLGSPKSDPYADSSGGDPLSGDTGPVDIVAVRRDDALIDAIAGEGPVATDSTEEFQLASLLANWRSEIVDAPLPPGPDLDEIVAAVNQEIGARTARTNARRRGQLRLVKPVAAAAAAVALILGGMTALSYNAKPGDALWGMKQVVFSQQAQTTIASNATDDMSKAAAAIDNDNPEQAKNLLQSASNSTSQINDSGRKKALGNRWQALYQQLYAKAPEVAASLLPTPETTPTPAPETSQQQSASSVPSPTPNPAAAPPTGPSNPTNPSTSAGPTAPSTPETPPTTPSEPPTHDQPTPSSEPTPSHGKPVPTTPSSNGGGSGEHLPPTVEEPVHPSAETGPPAGLLPPQGSTPSGVR